MAEFNSFELISRLPNITLIVNKLTKRGNSQKTTGYSREQFFNQQPVFTILFTNDSL